MPEPTPISVPPGLQGLADHDPAVIDALRQLRVELEQRSGLDERTIELARLAALVALAAPAESFAAHVTRAVQVGVSQEELWGVLMAVAPLVGVPRLIAAVPEVASALDGAVRDERSGR